MIVYKLLKKRKDGSLGSLYIDAGARRETGVWLKAEDHEKKGFAHRPGWHVTAEPKAPHIHPKPERVWYRCEIRDYTELKRPEKQGGIWYIANEMKLLNEVGPHQWEA